MYEARGVELAARSSTPLASLWQMRGSRCLALTPAILYDGRERLAAAVIFLDCQHVGVVHALQHWYRGPLLLRHYQVMPFLLHALLRMLNLCKSHSSSFSGSLIALPVLPVLGGELLDQSPGAEIADGGHVLRLGLAQMFAQLPNAGKLLLRGAGVLRRPIRCAIAIRTIRGRATGIIDVARSVVGEIDGAIDDAMLFIKLWRELRAITQSC